MTPIDVSILKKLSFKWACFLQKKTFYTGMELEARSILTDLLHSNMLCMDTILSYYLSVVDLCTYVPCGHFVT